LNIAVLAQPGSWYGRELTRAAGRRGHRCRQIHFPALVGSLGAASDSIAIEAGDLRSFDAVIVRTMPPGSLEQVVYRMDGLWRVAASGIPVLNPPKAIECAVDKYLASARLEAAGLTVPPTVVCENSEAALEAFHRTGGDVVVKPIFGSEGRGIVRVSDPELALRTFRTLERIGAVLYVQRFIENEGFDIRVMVLDGRILGAMKRHTNGDFRANVSQKATAAGHPITDREAETALRATEAVGARFAGVDLLYGRDGTCYVIEVNAVPGWRAFQRVTGLDVATAVISSLESSCNEKNKSTRTP
jgi:ribosomal protein S6--L-glutamate ligase